MRNTTMNADNRSTLDLARCVIVGEPEMYLNPFRDLIAALAKEKDQQKCLKKIEDLVVAESQGRSLRPEAGGETTKIQELPTEVSTAEAARILGVSKDTVLKLKAAGLLEYRNMAPPDSSRPVYAFALRSVLELRTSYERDERTPRLPREPQRRRMLPRSKKYKHVKLED
jgi:hypothetical protein